MKTGTFLLLVEAMQVPVVVMIVAISLHPKISKAYKGQASRYIAGLFQRNITIGFILNAAYIILNILTSAPVHLIYFPHANQLVNVLDLATGVFFCLVAFLGRFNQVKPWLAVILLSVLAGLIAWHNQNASYADYAAFECACFLSVPAYLLYEMRKPSRPVPTGRSATLLIIGFVLWALIQLLPLFSMIGQDSLMLSGFSVSILAKTLILAGLYDFTIQAANFTDEVQGGQIRDMNRLHELISQVTNAGDTDAHANKVVCHLTSDFFAFDYAIFSEVNYLQRKIFYKASCSVNPEVVDVEHWVLCSGIRFGHCDIMADVVRRRATSNVLRNVVDGVPIDIHSPDSPLNAEVYTTYHHEKLDRYFIPVHQLVNRSGQADGSRVVALLEVGFVLKPYELYRRLDVDRFGELNIYRDNCSQAYERLMQQELTHKVELMLRDCDKESRDDHIGYLQSLMRETCTMTGAVGCAMLLHPGPGSSEEEIKVLFEKVPERVRPFLEKNLRAYRPGRIAPDGAEAGQWAAVLARLRELKIARSCFSIELALSPWAGGLWLMLGDTKDAVNEVVVSVMRDVAGHIEANYSVKKFHNSVAELVLPNNAITDLEINMQPIIASLEHYFESPLVSVWLGERREPIRQKYASAAFQKSYPGYDALTLADSDIAYGQDHLIIAAPLAADFARDRHEQEFLRKNGVQAILQKPLSTAHQNFGAINIYFRGAIDHLNNEDAIFLSLLASKALITIQINNLVTAFRDISDSSVHSDLSATLQTVTDSAMELVNADPVLLFQSANGTDVFFRDVTYSKVEDFRDQAVLIDMFKKSDQHVELAEFILSGKSVYCNDRAEYLDFLSKWRPRHNQVRHFEQDFWTRESIQSMAAVRLADRIGGSSKAVGLMFINFRKKMYFGADLKRLLETFAMFASGAIASALIFQRNRRYLMQNIRMTKPILSEVLAHGALHNAHKTYLAINGGFYNILRSMNDNTYKTPTVTDIKAELYKLEPEVVRLFDQFRGLAKMYRPTDQLNLKRHSLSAIINGKLDLLATDLRKRNIVVYPHYPKTEIMLDCDEALLGDVFFNIINNAMQAISKRGRIDIRTQVTPADEARIDITDNGKGISEDIKGIITEPYVTDKPDGSGLGLAMSKLTLDQHAGRLRWTSVKGRTTFTINLPLHLKETTE